MEIISAAICSVTFGVGYLIRDGWPPLGHTQLARLGGAVTCGLGALVFGWQVALVVMAVALLSFYTDQKHAEGQRIRNFSDAKYLVISGITSIAPYDIVGWIYNGAATWMLLFLLALSKPLIWAACWKVFDRGLSVPTYWTVPTRMAAIIFGTLVGAIVAVSLSH